MLRREFLLGAAAGVAASSPIAALAADGSAAFEQGRVRRLDDGQSPGGGAPVS